MQKSHIAVLIAALVVVVIGVVAGVFVIRKRGVPFVGQKEQWTVGIYTGESPFDFSTFQGFKNPIMTAEDVTDMPTKFVADPFLIRDDSKWYLFFEAFNSISDHGDLVLATSTDGNNWHYEQVILDEPFHLAYPYVFKWEGEYYLIPDSFDADSVRLYKAVDFPTKWEFVQTLIDGKSLADSSVVYYQDRWWLFTADATGKNDTLRLFFADKLTGPWQEHPESPLVEGDANIARPGGRMLLYDDSLYRYTQDSDPIYGNQIWAFEITELTPTSYEEELVGETPILKADGTGWNKQSMHTIDPVQIEDDKWIAAVDGFGEYLVFGLQY